MIANPSSTALDNISPPEPDYTSGVMARVRRHPFWGRILGWVEVVGPIIGLIGGSLGVVAFFYARQ